MTTPTAEIRIASQEGAILSTQMGRASSAMAFVISNVLSSV